jgi:hypothetical protein
MGLAEKVGWGAVDWPSEPFDPFFNINTPEELAEAERILGARAEGHFQSRPSRRRPASRTS